VDDEFGGVREEAGVIKALMFVSVPEGGTVLLGVDPGGVAVWAGRLEVLAKPFELGVEGGLTVGDVLVVAVVVHPLPERRSVQL
jgi:hypothetical protein